QMLQKLQNYPIARRVTLLVMDQDTTTMAQIRKEVAFPVRNVADVNHVAKIIISDLYMLETKHDILKVESVKGHFNACVTYAMVQNKNNPEGLKGNLLAIVPHT